MSWALIFIIRLRFPPRKALVNNLLGQICIKKYRIRTIIWVQNENEQVMLLCLFLIRKIIKINWLFCWRK